MVKIKHIYIGRFKIIGAVNHYDDKASEIRGSHTLLYGKNMNDDSAVMYYLYKDKEPECSQEMTEYERIGLKELARKYA